MEGKSFLTEYMRAYKDDYILIGGNACALHFENLDAPFRATVDLDIVLVTESTNQDFYVHLTDYLNKYEYIGKSFKGSNSGGSAYRFNLGEEYFGQGHPVQIELFAKKPEYFDLSKAEATKLHITPIETGEGISNFSAILLDDDIYNFICSSRESLNEVSTVSLECLFGLKSIAWHNNQALMDDGKNIKIETILKHPSDMLRIVSVINPTITNYPNAIFESLQLSKHKFREVDVRAAIPLTSGMDFDVAIRYINEYVICDAPTLSF